MIPLLNLATLALLLVSLVFLTLSIRNLGATVSAQNTLLKAHTELLVAEGEMIRRIAATLGVQPTIPPGIQLRDGFSRSPNADRFRAVTSR